MRLLQRIVILGVIAAALGGPLPLPGRSAAPATRSPKMKQTSGTCWNWRTKERAFATLHNLARASRDISKMRLDPHLGKVARKHTYEMVSKSSLYHTPSTKLKRRVTRWTMLGENVGVGNTVDSLFQAFMNSPSHKANVLYKKFTYFGVGTVKKNGRLWVTIVFESSSNPGTRLNMPSC